VCCSVLQCVAVCCSVLQCVAVCCSVLQCVAVRCNALQCVAMCCSVLQCVALCDNARCDSEDMTSAEVSCASRYVSLCCNALQYVAARCSALQFFTTHVAIVKIVLVKRSLMFCCDNVLQCVASLLLVCCNAFQRAAVCCSVLQCAAMFQKIWLRKLISLALFLPPAWRRRVGCLIRIHNRAVSCNIL